MVIEMFGVEIATFTSLLCIISYIMIGKEIEEVEPKAEKIKMSVAGVKEENSKDSLPICVCMNKTKLLLWNLKTYKEYVQLFFNHNL